MNFWTKEPLGPEDDHHEDEQISPAGEIILRRRECIHDFEDVGGDLAQCRHCGERTRFSSGQGSDRIMICLQLLPKHVQLMYVPRSMLDQVILDHYDRHAPSGKLQKELNHDNHSH